MCSPSLPRPPENAVPVPTSDKEDEELQVRKKERNVMKKDELYGHCADSPWLFSMFMDGIIRKFWKILAFLL